MRVRFIDPDACIRGASVALDAAWSCQTSAKRERHVALNFCKARPTCNCRRVGQHLPATAPASHAQAHLMKRNYCVDLIEPDAGLSSAMKSLLSHFSLNIHCSADAEQFLALHAERERSANSEPQPTRAHRGCVLVGSTLPRAEAMDIVRCLRRNGYREPIIVIRPSSAQGSATLDDATDRNAALLAGANEVLEVATLKSFLFGRRQDPQTGQLLSPAAGVTRLRDGRHVSIRSMRPEDAAMEQQFVRGLSASARRMRFFSSIKELSPAMLHAFTHPQFPSSVALIATTHAQNPEVQIAVARYAPTGKPGVAEFAVVVDDAWQGLGLAGRLLRGLVTAATVAGLDALEGLVLAENMRMRRFAKALGFQSTRSTDDASVIQLTRALHGAPA